MKIDRLMGIVLQLLNHKKRTAKQLADFFNVSVRTIKRDMDTLTLAGIPIYAELGASGGYQLLDHYKLKQNYLNKGEAQVLMTFLEGLSDHFPVGEIQSVKEKFASLHGEALSNQKLVIVPSPLASNADYLKNRIETLTTAIDNKQKTIIDYVSQEFKKTKRTIHPYTLIMMTNQWYLYGYCELRADFRLFKLFRIQYLELLNDRYIEQSLPNDTPWQSFFSDSRQVIRVVLLLDRCLLGKLPDYIDFNMCKMTTEGIEVTLNYPVDEWFYSFIMGFVPHVKIISPQSVKKEFVTRLKKSIALNDID